MAKINSASTEARTQSRLLEIVAHIVILVLSIGFGVVGGTIAAFMTSPFWNWFEGATGIESFGHGGPSDWVFEFMAAVGGIFLFSVLEYVRYRRRHH